MTNIGSINFGSFINSSEIPVGEKIFSFGDFVLYKNCSYGIDKEYYIDELNIKDDPNTNNKNIISDLYEGLYFLNEGYSLKDITLKILIFETNSRTYSDIVNDVKDFFAPLRGDIEFNYRGEIMTIKAVKNSLKFDLKSDVKSFVVNFTGEPFFKSSVKRTLGSNISGTSGVVSIGNDGHRIYPKMRIIPTGNCSGMAIGNSAGNFRYIRDWANGSSANAGTHWVEIQAIEKYTGENRAFGKSCTSSTGNTTDISRITDGDLSTGLFFDIGGAGLRNVVVDLGAIYDIDEIKIWRYYADNRVYFNTKTEVSADGVNWTTIFDSAEEGTYIETALGKTHNIEEKNIYFNGKRVIQENISSGEIIDIDFGSGKIEKNGLPVKTIGTLPVLQKEASIVLSCFDKYTYPALNQSKDSKTGMTGSGIASVTDSSEFYRIGHFFPSHGITNLKKVTLGGNNIFAYSIFFSAKIYTSTAKTTLIATLSKTVYAGQNVTGIVFDIDDLGLNLSSYADVYIEFDIGHLSSLPNTSTEYFRLYRTVSGSSQSYDQDMTVMTWNWDVVLEGISTSYVPTGENVSEIDYTLEYYNNFL